MKTIIIVYNIIIIIILLCKITVSIKYRVQNPRRVTKPKSIASMHAQICPCIIMCSATCECGISDENTARDRVHVT